jgi:two-component system, NarL family, nitrate/nitrite response regulator NarL
VARRCVSVVVADRHPVVLCGLQSMLCAESDFNVVATCRDGKTLLEVIRDRSPDLALLDPLLPEDLSGLRLLAAIKSEHLGTRVVFFSLSFDAPETASAFARGAYGIIPKEAAPELLLRSLRRVASGQRLLPRAIRDIKSRKRQNSDPLGTLENWQTAMTARERQIMHLVCQGLSNKEVGRQLHVSGGTITVHLHRIYRKLAIQNRTALAALASRDSTWGDLFGDERRGIARLMA